MSERGRLHWPFRTAILLGLPVWYVFGFGPACWINCHTANESMLVIYGPLIRAGTRTVEQPKLYRPALQRFLKWYADLGADNFATFCDDRIHWTIFERR